jgi:hypothetical protein
LHRNVIIKSSNWYLHSSWWPVGCDGQFCKLTPKWSLCSLLF